MDNTVQTSGVLGGTLALYGFAALILAVIVGSFLIAGLQGLVTCAVVLTVLVIVMMAFSARN